VVRVRRGHQARDSFLRHSLLLVHIVSTDIVDEDGEEGLAQGTLGLEVDEGMVLLKVGSSLHMCPLLDTGHAEGVQAIANHRFSSWRTQADRAHIRFFVFLHLSWFPLDYLLFCLSLLALLPLALSLCGKSLLVLLF